MDPFCAKTKPPFETARPGVYTMYMDQFLPYRSKWYMKGELGSRKVVPSKIGDLLVRPHKAYGPNLVGSLVSG